MNFITFEDAVRQMERPMFSTMVKPIGSHCNLDCRYCYYLDKKSQFSGFDTLMSDEILNAYIRQYFEATSTQTVNFCWHGGEPLLLGIDFFHKVVRLQRSYSDGRTVENSLQTNGILIDDRWGEFFADNDFLVGISIDGTPDVHDSNRVDKSQRPTFLRVLRAINILRRHSVRFNTLSVVSKTSEGRGAEIYKFLRDAIGSRFMQFLPAVELIEQRGACLRPRIVSPSTSEAVIAPWSVSPSGYGRFLCDVFDEWIRSDVGSVFVQMFDATLANWCGVNAGLCAMNETCGSSLVVEHNGDVFSCDHFVYPDYKLGNIMETHLHDLFKSTRHFEFGIAKRNGCPPECFRCEFYFACKGGCPKHRFQLEDTSTPRYYLCESMKMWFSHSQHAMKRMRDLIASNRPPSEIMQ